MPDLPGHSRTQLRKLLEQADRPANLSLELHSESWHLRLVAQRGFGEFCLSFRVELD